MEAVELYRKAGRHPEAAKLLGEIAQEVVKTKANPLRYVRDIACVYFCVFVCVCVCVCVCASSQKET